MGCIYCIRCVRVNWDWELVWLWVHCVDFEFIGWPVNKSIILRLECIKIDNSTGGISGVDIKMLVYHKILIHISYLYRILSGQLRAGFLNINFLQLEIVGTNWWWLILYCISCWVNQVVNQIVSIDQRCFAYSDVVADGIFKVYWYCNNAWSLVVHAVDERRVFYYRWQGFPTAHKGKQQRN